MNLNRSALLKDSIKNEANYIPYNCLGMLKNVKCQLHTECYLEVLKFGKPVPIRVTCRGHCWTIWIPQRFQCKIITEGRQIVTSFCCASIPTDDVFVQGANNQQYKTIQKTNKHPSLRTLFQGEAISVLLAMIYQIANNKTPPSERSLQFEGDCFVPRKDGDLLVWSGLHVI